jgi:ParB-like chromosome segregation protein Spo0J
MNTIPITSIVVRDRQRKAPDVDEAFVASVRKRLIHPIVLRRENGDDAPILVAGERRLLGLQKAGISDLEEGIHFRFFDDLSPTEARVVELEENVKRSDLPWRDHVTAVAGLHKIYSDENPGWTPEKTAKEINASDEHHLRRILVINKNLQSPLLRDCTGIVQAYSILEHAAQRRIAAIVGDIARVGNQIFETKDETEGETEDEDSSPDSPPPTGDPVNGLSPSPLPDPKPKPPPPAVICVDFSKWLQTYSGPKFTLIHCDFPYDIKYDSYAKSVTSSTEDYDSTGYWPLLDALCDNLDKIASYQSHVMFWFSMKFYQRTKNRLIKGGLFVHDHPLIWHKTDNAGIIPGADGTYPRRIYETALLCSRGKRPLIKPLANAYGAPTASNPVHPSQKPEPVLRHFFSMLVDETTDVLDPTCGSGSALRAAEDLGARSVLGLEFDLKYAETAENLTQTARTMRRLHR